MNKKINIVLAVLVILTLASIVGVFTYLFEKQTEKDFKLQSLAPTTIQDQITKVQDVEKELNQNDSMKDWKTYTNNEYGFEFKYPTVISISKSNDAIKLIHSIPHKHNNPCDFKGDSPLLEKLTDFDLSIGIANKNLKDAIIANESVQAYENYFKDGRINLVDGYIDKFSIGSLNGYRIVNSFEGCGEYMYYFPINESKTLLVSRLIIAEFQSINTDSQKNLKIPGIILPEQEENFFNKILSTFKFTK